MKAMLNRLLVGQRLALLGFLGLVLTAIPLSLYLQAEWNDIQFARKEQQGIPPARAALKAVYEMQLHRGLSALELSGREDARAQREAKARDVEKALADLDKARESLPSPNLDAAVLVANELWKKLSGSVATKSIGVSAAVAGHTGLIEEMFYVLEVVRDVSGLSLDPEADGYFLHVAALITLPELTEALGQLRARGVALLGARQASEADRVAMAALIQKARELQESASSTLSKVVEHNPGLRSLMSQPLHETIAAIDRAIALTDEQIVRRNALTFSPSDYLAQYTASIDTTFAFSGKAGNWLGEALSNRVNALVKRTTIVGTLVVLLIALASGLGYYIVRSIADSVNRLSDTVQKFAAGDNDARSGLESKDELGQLSQAFDKMMDERVSVQAKIQTENEQLNNSVLSLLQAVAQLSRKDLTTRVPVAEDVTGPVGDALNLLSSETAKVLQQVTDISADVTAASLKVKEQSDTVVTVAEVERDQVEKTAADLDVAAQAMGRIATLAQACNVAADNAIKTTQGALSTVSATVGGINGIRETIRETEKRIKRLGERSQEISGVVNLINTIAERTHILALNASMHAASAGEAGRGFAVVADEVQRLAENARQATAQIATLVNNIQVETADTVTTMNNTISQVVEGSKLAEQAGEQMKRTQETTAELVASVQQIAETSTEQARMSSELLNRAGEIRKSTQITSEQLKQQTAQTENLVEYAKSLLGAVRVFKLPG
jgi:methyl-accepting chemotaxis protein